MEKRYTMRAKCVSVDGDSDLDTTICKIEYLIENVENDDLCRQRRSDARMDLYRKLDTILYCITNTRFRLLSELNEIQSNDDGETIFYKKSDIPLRIVNLVLSPYNIEIEED